jgi:AraC-like DNA-binding protein
MSYLLFGGGMYMVLIGIVWFIYPNRSAMNSYFSAMYVSTGLIVLYAWAERARVIYGAYLLYNMQIPLCYVFAPLLYYGFAQITDLKREPSGLFTPHFIPAIVSVPCVLGTNILNARVFASLPPNVLPQDIQRIPAFFFVHLLGLGSNLYILYFLTRILVTGARFVRHASVETLKELRLLLVFVAMFYIDIILMMVAHVVQNIDLLHTAKFLSSATFIFYSFYSFRYPEYAQRVVRKAKDIRYKNTQLRGLNTKALLERLSYLMEQEKAFREMELSLPSLSSRLMVTSHQLSEILNEHLHLGFNAFLNEYRVREAERLLVERPDATILEIAFEVGFNSKTSFYSNFLQHTGLSPSEYRKRRSTSKNGPVL